MIFHKEQIAGLVLEFVGLYQPNFLHYQYSKFILDNSKC